MISFKSYRSIKPEDRIILSPDTKIIFRNASQHKDNSIKPSGLWYAVGTSWMEWISNEMPEWQYKSGTKELLHVHKIEINENAIIRLNTKEAVMAFEKKYGVNAYGAQNFINWSQVAKDYAGIECNPYFYGPLRNRMWYNTWDVASGCVWSNRAVKSIKLIE